LQFWSNGRKDDLLILKSVITYCSTTWRPSLATSMANFCSSQDLGLSTSVSATATETRVMESLSSRWALAYGVSGPDHNPVARMVQKGLHPEKGSLVSLRDYLQQRVLCGWISWCRTQGSKWDSVTKGMSDENIGMRSSQEAPW
jgi:hypothetical protein